MTLPHIPGMFLRELVTSLPSESPIEVGRTRRAAWGQTIVMVTEHSDSDRAAPGQNTHGICNYPDKPPDSLQRGGKIENNPLEGCRHTRP